MVKYLQEVLYIFENIYVVCYGINFFQLVIIPTTLTKLV